MIYAVPRYIGSMLKNTKLTTSKSGSQVDNDFGLENKNSPPSYKTMDLIHIDIFIPIFGRHNLTKKILKHYSNVKKTFSDRAFITFTIVGSEDIVSKQLVSDTLGIENYYEFTQLNNISKLDMLAEKYKFGRIISLAKTPDVAFLAGSNDFIPYLFFEGVITNFSPIIPQVYGIGSREFSNSLVMISKYDDCNNRMSDIPDERFLWDGIYRHNSDNHNFCGGIIGINKISYLKDGMASFWHWNEGTIEKLCCNFDITPIKIPNIYYFNPKHPNDINPWEFLYSQVGANLRALSITDDVDSEMRERIEKDIVYFNSL